MTFSHFPARFKFRTAELQKKETHPQGRAVLTTWVQSRYTCAGYIEILFYFCGLEKENVFTHDVEYSTLLYNNILFCRFCSHFYSELVMHVFLFDTLANPLKRSLLSSIDVTLSLCVSHDTKSGNTTIFDPQREQLCGTVSYSPAHSSAILMSERRMYLSSALCREGLITYFLGEGGRDHTVHLTVPYPIVVNSHAKLCV
jgi:hypothetical protein